jgi:hypothetical protein
MTAVAQVKGGFWPDNGVSVLTQISGVGNGRGDVARALNKKNMLATREKLDTLLGVAPGQPAVATRTYVANSEELGGKRAIATETLINRNTTAADVTELRNDLLTYSTRTYDTTPVPNLDGNPLGTR